MLPKFIEERFGISETKFLEALKKSPGAEGYIHGAIGEFLFMQYAEGLGYEVKRIKEKPEGGDNAKSEDARGDFYIRKKGSTKNEWFVIECKGLKSNAEKRLGLTKRKSLLAILKKFSIDRDKKIKSNLKSSKKAYEKKKIDWKKKNGNKSFPRFKWNQENPSSGFPDLTHLWKNATEIENWLKNYKDSDFNEDAYWDLKAPFRLLQTHMPSSRIDPKTKIKSTGPLVTEFNILCIDTYLRTGKHDFVFANAKELNHQAKSPNHLSQNYTIDALIESEGFKRHDLLEPWHDNLDDCISKTKPKPRKLDESQLDKRGG